MVASGSLSVVIVVLVLRLHITHSFQQKFQQKEPFKRQHCYCLSTTSRRSSHPKSFPLVCFAKQRQPLQKWQQQNNHQRLSSPLVVSMELSSGDKTEAVDDNVAENLMETTTTISNTTAGITATQKNHNLLLGILYGIGETTSLFVSLTFYAALAYRRDAFMVSFFIGAICNGILSKVLKKVLNQERPTVVTVTEDGVMKQQQQQSDKGMPSSHAMSLGFLGTFTALTLSSMYAKIFIVLYVGLSLIYRVQTKLHTKSQVFVGLILGTANGAMWKLFCDNQLPYVNSNMNIMEWVSDHFLNDAGLLPWPMLVIPAIIGIVVVGSFERRIPIWIKSYQERQQQEKNQSLKETKQM